MNYHDLSKLLKTISDEKRLEIIDLLSCGELCGCDLLEHFSITQPTLSHHMKKLEEQNIVIRRREGTKIIYQLNYESIQEVKRVLDVLTTDKDQCHCHSIKEAGAC